MVLGSTSHRPPGLKGHEAFITCTAIQVIMHGRLGEPLEERGCRGIW